jgi:hypothetical protein
MVICDGFNVPPPGVEPIPFNSSETEASSINSTTTTTTTISNQLPFPRVPPPAPPARTMIPHSTEQNQPTNGHHTSPSGPFLNGTHKSNGYQDKPSLTPTPTPTPTPPRQLHGLSNSHCNYDNLRSIDSDESHLTTPEPPQTKPAFLLSNGSNKIKSTPANPSPAVQQQVTTSLPLTDKNIMSNIMNKSNGSDIKSQSMMTNQITPVAVKNASDSVRSFKDKMKFFETQKEEIISKRKWFI